MEYLFSEDFSGNVTISERVSESEAEDCYGETELVKSDGIDIDLTLSVDDEHEGLSLSLNAYHVKGLDEDRHFHTGLDIKFSMEKISKLRRMLEFFEKEMAANGGKL